MCLTYALQNHIAMGPLNGVASDFFDHQVIKIRKPNGLPSNGVW